MFVKKVSSSSQVSFENTPIFRLRFPGFEWIGKSRQGKKTSLKILKNGTLLYQNQFVRDTKVLRKNSWKQ
jgi:hypothetical protein